MNVWPTNMESMRISYGGSEVLRCTVQLAYDRFFTEFDKTNMVEIAEDRGTISNVPLYKGPVRGETMSSNPEFRGPGNNKKYVNLNEVVPDSQILRDFRV